MKKHDMFFYFRRMFSGYINSRSKQKTKQATFRIAIKM